MKLLAFDTATEVCSVALLYGEQQFERHQHKPMQQADLLLPMIDELMAEAGLKSSELDAIAVGRGPGSFTGLRLAAGVAQGIALAADIPVIPVSTLAVVAQTALSEHHEETVLATVDARMQEVYWGVYRRDTAGLMQPVSTEQVSAVDRIEIDTGRVFGAGSGFRVFACELKTHLASCLKGYDANLWPRASHLLPLAVYGFVSGWAVSAAEVAPVYIRDNVAHKKQA